jgi:hypothetical protein
MLFAEYCWDKQRQEDEMGEECNAQEELRNA